MVLKRKTFSGWLSGLQVAGFARSMGFSGSTLSHLIGTWWGSETMPLSSATART